MGQKTHPTGFRLISTQNHLSTWYTEKHNYSKFLKEDFFIRELTRLYFKNFLMLSTIEINRFGLLKLPSHCFNIKIKALYPKVKDLYKNIIFSKIYNKTSQKSKKKIYKKKQQQKMLMQYIHKKIVALNRLLRVRTGKYCFIQISFLKSIYDDAFLIAQRMGEQLTKKIPYRRILNQTITQFKCLSYKGLKIEISGRLQKTDNKASSEWKLFGKIPLHTLKAKVDYASYFINTKDGVFGIKVWLLKK